MMWEVSDFDTPARRRAKAIMNEGVELLDGGTAEAAAAKLRTSASTDPTYFGSWFNLGLAYKKLREWQAGFEAFEKALARLPKEAPTELYASILWNIGITASIIKKWPRAHWVWHRFGHEVHGTVDEPPSIPMGPAWVRGTTGLPILADRLDPVRMRIGANGPLDSVLPPGSIVVHDGERVGSAPYKEIELPIFPVLAVLQIGKSEPHSDRTAR